MKYSRTRMTLVACMAVLMASLGGWALNTLPGTITAALAQKGGQPPTGGGGKDGQGGGSKDTQTVANARAALEKAQANERANRTKENAAAVDTAFAEYNAVIRARAAQIQARMMQLAAIISGGQTTATAIPRGAKPSAELTEYNALKAELDGINPGAQAPAPDSTPESEPNNTCATPNPIIFDQNCAIISGSINPGNDLDFFSFQAPPTAKVWIYTDTGGPQDPGATSRDTVVTLFNSDCSIVLEEDDDDGTGNGCDTTTESTLASVIAGRSLPVGGTYVIRVREFDQSTSVISPYKLFVVLTTLVPPSEVEPNDTAATANPIGVSLGTPLPTPIGIRAGTITPAGDCDYYSVVAEAGNILFISGDGDPERDGTSTDLVIELRSPADTLLFSADSGLGGDEGNPEGEGFCFTILTSGTYFVKVCGFGDSTGTYNIMVATCNSDRPPECGPSLIINGASTTSEPDTTAEATANLSAILSAQGTTVTVVDSPPASLTGFSCVYDIRFNAPISTTERNTFLGYLQNGGRLYVTGENSGFLTRNNSVLAFIAAADIGVFGYCQADPPYTCSDPTICSTPNPVTTVNLPAPGGLTVLGSGTALITGGDGLCKGAGVWRPGQLGNAVAGSLIVMWDINVLQPSQGGGTSNQNLIRNITSFLCVCVETCEGDTQPPTINCPTGFTATTAQNICPAPNCGVVTFSTPTATDNCSGATVVCSPASGSCFPVGTTTVSCTATDSSGNTATCSFPVTVFDVCIQDETNANNVMLFISQGPQQGEYRFCCNGSAFFIGTGIVRNHGCQTFFELDVLTADGTRRIRAQIDRTVRTGNASLQLPPGTNICNLIDKNITNNTCTNCAGF